jgi:glycosyltransferase involved in cell wall biosynthesis
LNTATTLNEKPPGNKSNNRAACPDPLRVVLVCDEYPPRPHGGIGTFVHCLAHGLANDGHEITVVGFGKVAECVNDGNVRVVTLAANRFRYVGNLISRLRLRKWLSARAKAGQVDLIEVPDYKGLLPFGVRNCPVVVRLHLAETPIQLAASKSPNSGVKFYERRTLIANRNWIAVSNYILGLTQATFGVAPERCKRIYNPVSQPGFDSPIPKGAPGRYILYASAISQRKGALVLAEAVRGILEQDRDLHLVYVGGMPSGENGISSLILAKLGSDLASRVHFVGYVTRQEVLAWMKGAAVFAFPSNLESFGLVVLEAMQMGVPVVCTSLASGPEIVKDGWNGLLADPAVPSDWARKIKMVLDNPTLANQLRKNGCQTVRNFSLEGCLRATVAFYRECLS